MTKFAVCFAGTICLCLNTIFAQGQTVDSIARSTSTPYFAALYNRTLGESSGLYSGIEYKPGNPLIQGTPFYTDDQWHTGQLAYDGITYSNVSIKYDLFTDQLVGLLYNHFSAYVFNREKVTSFDLLNHHFVYITADSLNREVRIKEGFYDELYGGNTQVLAQRSKTIESINNSTSAESRYINKTRYYLKNKNNYYAISGNSSLLNALQDKKKLIQQYIKSNHIRVQTNPDDTLVKIASYYDTLTN